MSQTLQQPATRPHLSDPRSTSIDTASQPTASPRGGWLRRTLTGTVSWIPSVVVVVSLTGLAWHGHHNDWKLPSMQALSGRPNAVAGPSWCENHGVPEDQCVSCRPGLIEVAPKLSFCNEHGVHGCILCNPELAQTKEQFAPGDEELERVSKALKVRPRLANLSISGSPGTRIQFASVESMNKAGVDVEPVIRDRVVESVTASGEIRYDETKAAMVAPQADGVVRQIAVEIGDWVDAGDLLVLLDSSEVGRLKTQLVAAISDQRLKQAAVARRVNFQLPNFSELCQFVDRRALVAELFRCYVQP